MATMPTYEQWMKQTYSLRHKRSDTLKALDEGIRTNASKDQLNTLLATWIIGQQQKGRKWQKSVRNKNQAMTDLYRVVNEMDKRILKDDEREALKYLSRMQAMALAKQFEGKKLSFKSTTLVGMAQGAGTNWQKFKTGAGSAVSGGKTAKGFVKGAINIKKGAKLFHDGGKAATHGAAGAAMQKKILDLCKSLTPGLNPDKVFAHLKLGSVAETLSHRKIRRRRSMPSSNF